jgi:hypothetical protein
MRDNESEHKPESKKNGLLTMLLSSGGDVSVKLITLALVVVTGGGNLFATKSLSDQEHADRDRASREIHQIYDQFDAAIRRQKNLEDMLERIDRKLNK